MSGNKGLTQEVIADLLQRLKQQPLIDERVLAALSSLADGGKLTDIPTLQAALQIPAVTQNEKH